MDAIAGYDAADPDTRPLAARNFRRIAAENFGLDPRFAFVKTPVWDKADAEAREAIEELARELGEACFTYDLPEQYTSAWDNHRAIMSVEMAHNIGDISDKGGDKISTRFRELVAEGRGVGATRYLDAIAQAGALRASLVELFEQECSAILTLSAPGVAPEGAATGKPMFNSLWTLVGLPAVNLPLLTGEGGMPLGVQLVGAPGDDARLLRTANWLVSKVSGG
jgi:Asp-tRNA(Asn)/Glu-tRNA(Gln) amidotransferase A subunit family amidase